MSGTALDAAINLADHENPGVLTTMSGSEGDRPRSPTRSPDLGNSLDYQKTERRWNGHPMDWESWPNGRPGPYVSEAKIRGAMSMFHAVDEERGEWSRTEEKIFHVAEFSSSGRREYHTHYN